MQIRDIMSRPVELAAPDDSVRVAAKKMTAMDCGILPLGGNDRLVGMIGDRDIVARAVAEGYDPDECSVRLAPFLAASFGARSKNEQGVRQR